MLDRLEKKADLVFIVLAMADRLDPELIDRMLAAGMRYLACFPESGADRIRRLMRKPIRLDRLLARMRYASEQGAVVSCSILFGWPNETADEAEQSIRLAAEPFIDVVLCNQLIYFAGAELSKHLGRRRIELDTPEYFDHVSNPGKLCLAEYGVEVRAPGEARPGSEHREAGATQDPRQTREPGNPDGVRRRQVRGRRPVRGRIVPPARRIVDALGDPLVGKECSLAAAADPRPRRGKEVVFEVQERGRVGRIGLRQRDDARSSYCGPAVRSLVRGPRHHADRARGGSRGSWPIACGHARGSRVDA